MNELDKYDGAEGAGPKGGGGGEEFEGTPNEAFGSMMAEFQRTKLRNWFIRTAIGAVVFGYLASHYSWARWILYLWIPMAVLSLLAILILPKLLQYKIQSVLGGHMGPGQSPFGRVFDAAGSGGVFGETIDVEGRVDDGPEGSVIDVEAATVYPLRKQLEILEGCGVNLGEGRTLEDLLAFHDEEDYEHTAFELALVTLGRELDAEPPGRYLSPNAYSLDGEGVDGDGSYVKIVQQLARIAGEPERLSEVKDFLDPDAQRAELRYRVDGEPKECTPTYKDEWVDALAVEQIMGDLVRPGHGFYGLDTGRLLIVLYLSKANAERLDDYIPDGLAPLALGA